MAITANKYVSAKNVAALNALIVIEIAASRYPNGGPSIRQTQAYPPILEISLGCATGGTSTVGWKLLQSASLTDLATQVTAQIALGYLPTGDLIAFQPDLEAKPQYFQAVNKAS